uniref:Secreted protein n=1 Tax=Anopheles darlingi TaxID=43151 RepID=A0A2M4DHM2_ANODA
MHLNSTIIGHIAFALIAFILQQTSGLSGIRLSEGAVFVGRVVSVTLLSRFSHCCMFLCLPLFYASFVARRLCSTHFGFW